MSYFADTDSSSCDCNMHQEHIMELTTDNSPFSLPVFENMLMDYSGNCVICNLKLSSTTCKKLHECSCPPGTSITLESKPLIAGPSSALVIKKKKIGPNPVGNLDAIVNLTEAESPKNLCKSKGKKRILPSPCEYIDLESVSSASLYGQPKDDDITSLLENADQFQFHTAMTESAIAELMESNDNSIWGIDNVLQSMTDKSNRIAEWIEGAKTSCSSSLPSTAVVADYEDNFPECITYSISDSSNLDPSLPEIVHSDTSELYEIKSIYSSTPESPEIIDDGEFYIRKRGYDSATDDDCFILEEKKPKTSP